MPKKAEKTPAPKKPAKKQRFGHIAFKEREYFSQNLALLLKSGVSIGQALDALTATTRSRAMKQRLAAMQADIEAGFSLANALKRSGIVSGQTLALVQLGEQSGRLIDNLELAAQQEEKRHMFRSKLRSALIYPTFVLGLTLVVGLSVAWFLLPRLSDTFSQLNAKLPPLSQVVIQFGIFLKQYGIVAVPGFIAFCILLGYILFAFPRTKWIGQRILFALPGIGRLMREIEVAQFGYLFGTLLEVGLPITQAIGLLVAASSSIPYQELYRQLGKNLDDGYSFKESLASYRSSKKLLEPAVQQMIISGERSGSLSTVLMTIGRTYEQKADATTENLEAILEPFLLLFVAAGVLLVAVAVILPIYSLVGGLNK